MNVELHFSVLFGLLVSCVMALHNARSGPKSMRLYAAKFDPSNFVKVSIKKPLGLVFQEVAENKKEVSFMIFHFNRYI
jgi:hypothetical protein